MSALHQPGRNPLPDRIAILIAKDKRLAAPSDFAGKDGFNPFEMHLGANHGDGIAFAEDKIVGLHKFRAGEVDFNGLGWRQPQDQV